MCEQSVGPVLLDFPYSYPLDGNKLYCNAPTSNTDPTPCGGVIDYDDGYNHLYCTKCGTMYKAIELKKAIDQNMVIKIEKGERRLKKMKVAIGRGDNVRVIRDTSLEGDMNPAPAIQKPKKRKHVDRVGSLKVKVGGRIINMNEEIEKAENPYHFKTALVKTGTDIPEEVNTDKPDDTEYHFKAVGTVVKETEEKVPETDQIPHTEPKSQSDAENEDTPVDPPENTEDPGVNESGSQNNTTETEDDEDPVVPENPSERFALFHATSTTLKDLIPELNEEESMPCLVISPPEEDYSMCDQYGRYISITSIDGFAIEDLSILTRKTYDELIEKISALMNENKNICQELAEYKEKYGEIDDVTNEDEKTVSAEPAGESKKTDRLRDERGRFAKAEEPKYDTSSPFIPEEVQIPVGAAAPNQKRQSNKKKGKR